MAVSAGSARSRPVLLAGAVLGLALTLVAGLFLGVLLSDDPRAEATPKDGSVDVGFLRDMRDHHAQAVKMSVMVRDATEDPEVRTLALDVLLTQQQQLGQMYGWLADWDVSQTSAAAPMSWMGTGSAEGTDAEDGSMTMSKDASATMPGMATKSDLAALAAARGERAERMYLQLMIPHHQGAVTMAKYAATRADDPEVVRLAQTIVRSQTAELDVLRSMLDARGGPVALS